MSWGIRFTIILAIASSALTGCGKIGPGLEAFYGGDFDTSIKNLEPIVKTIKEYQAKDKWPFKAKKSQVPHLAELVRCKSTIYFQVWHAYVGSYMGKGKTDVACAEIKNALTPIKIHVKHSHQVVTFDPANDSLNWPMEVYDLRSWKKMIPCPDPLN